MAFNSQIPSPDSRALGILVNAGNRVRLVSVQIWNPKTGRHIGVTVDEDFGSVQEAKRAVGDYVNGNCSHDVVFLNDAVS